MSRYLARRLLLMLPNLFGILVLVFVLFHLVGGDPAYVLAGKYSNPDDIANIRHQLGVDRSWWEQFGIFLRQTLSLDFGRSWATQEPVTHILSSRLGPSLAVLLPVLVLETVLALILALLLAGRRGSGVDHGVTLLTTAAMSVSLLVYVICGQYLLAFRLGWFPVQGWAPVGRSWLPYAELPILLGLAVSLAPSLRLYRSFVLDELDQDYVRTARAKGLSEARLMGVHVLRNAAIPVLTNLLSGLPNLLVGSFLIERFFSIPGIGREAILAVEHSDFPVIQAVTLLVAVATLLCNLLADLVSRWIDPRVRLT